MFYFLYFRKAQPLEQDPKFIVTLDGINSSYFKKDTDEKIQIFSSNNKTNMNNKPAAIIAPMKHVAEVVEKKPPMILKKRIEENNKPLRKRITAPEPEPEEEKLSNFEKPLVKQSAVTEVKKARKRITGPDDPKPQIQVRLYNI